jgi:hypothetical protein
MLPALARSARRRTATAKDARFATRPDLDIFSNYPDAAVMPMFAGGGGPAAGQGGVLAA